MNPRVVGFVVGTVALPAAEPGPSGRYRSAADGRGQRFEPFDLPPHHVQGDHAERPEGHVDHGPPEGNPRIGPQIKASGMIPAQAIIPNSITQILRTGSR